MTDETTTEDQPRKGRSNAIATYETLNGLDVKLTRVETKLENLIENLTKYDRSMLDHEARIRLLEASTQGLSTRGNQTRDTWVAVIAVAGLLTGFINTALLLWRTAHGAG